LKNAIDWVSRARPVPFKGKSGLLLSASPSFAGGIRGLWQLRIPLEGLGVLVYPDMFPLPSADEAFDEDDQLRDPKTRERLDKIIAAYLKTAEALARR
jgi:NAD(P)H-dependent FMN reductase